MKHSCYDQINSADQDEDEEADGREEAPKERQRRIGLGSLELLCLLPGAPLL